jgi:hypothetical protein
VCPVDHRFALNSPALLSAPSKIADLGVQRLHVDRRRCCPVAARPENIGSPALELRFTRRDLIGVNVELLRQLRQRSIALDGGKRYFRLEGRCVIPTRSSAHGRS